MQRFPVSLLANMLNGKQNGNQNKQMGSQH